MSLLLIFQSGDEDTTPAEGWDGTTVLQLHKADPASWHSGYNVSRERYARLKKKFKIEDVEAGRELLRKEREVQKDLGLRKIEYDQYGFEVDRGDAAFHELLRNLEAQQTQRVFGQVRSYISDAAARMEAIRRFQAQAAMTQRIAEMKQFARDTEEEEEALELLMMDD